MNKWNEFRDTIEDNEGLQEIILAGLLLAIATAIFGALQALFGVEPQVSFAMFAVMLVTALVSRKYTRRGIVLLVVPVGMLCLIFVSEVLPDRFLIGWFLLSFIGLDVSFLLRKLFEQF